MTEVKTPLGDGALELIKSMLEGLKKGFTVTSRGDDIFEIIDIQAENLHHLMTEAYQAKEAIQRVREYARILDVYPDAIYSAGFIALKIREALDGEQG